MIGNDPYAAARAVLRITKIHTVPIDVFEILKQNKIICNSYDILIQLGEEKLVSQLRRKKIEGICNQSVSGYSIWYDHTISPKERIPFTIAHELGHIVLGHSKSQGALYDFKQGTTNSKNHEQEREADNFAGELLRSPFLIQSVNLSNPDEIRDIFHVSYDCATVGLSKLKNLGAYPDIKKFYKNQFPNFINEKFCTNCHYRFTLEGAKFCPICGSPKLVWGNQKRLMFQFFAVEGELPTIMKYQEYEATVDGKTKKCLRCDNDEIGEDHAFCIICGLPTRNRCLAHFQYDHRGDIESSTAGCGRVIPLNARYCPYCGAESIYGHENVLASWQAVKNSLSALSDDDPPF